MNYGKYGVTKAELEPIIDDGIQNYDLSLEAIYSGLRMSLASAFNEHEYFSLDDVMAITGGESGRTFTEDRTMSAGIDRSQRKPG